MAALVSSSARSAEVAICKPAVYIVRVGGAGAALVQRGTAEIDAVAKVSRAARFRGLGSVAGSLCASALLVHAKTGCTFASTRVQVPTTAVGTGVGGAGWEAIQDLSAARAWLVSSARAFHPTNQFLVGDKKSIVVIVLNVRDPSRQGLAGRFVRLYRTLNVNTERSTVPIVTTFKVFLQSRHARIRDGLPGVHAVHGDLPHSWQGLALVAVAGDVGVRRAIPGERPVVVSSVIRRLTIVCNNGRIVHDTK